MKKFTRDLTPPEAEELINRLLKKFDTSTLRGFKSFLSGVQKKDQEGHPEHFGEPSGFDVWKYRNLVPDGSMAVEGAVVIGHFMNKKGVFQGVCCNPSIWTTTGTVKKVVSRQIKTRRE